MRRQITSEFRKLATTRSIYAMASGLAVIVGLGVAAGPVCSGRSSARRSCTCR
jgi:hypothetical protein